MGCNQVSVRALTSPILRIGLLALAAMGLAEAASAATLDGRPKIMIHLRPTTTKNACGSGELSNCRNAITSGYTSTVGSGPYYFGYLVVARGEMESIAGLQCGITYQDGGRGDNGDLDRIDVFGWTNCAELNFSTPFPDEWPRSGSGAIITWRSDTDCQRGETAVAGYFYMTCYGGFDYMSVTPRPVDQLAKVSDCLAHETTLQMGDLGWVTFSPGATSVGCNPCKAMCIPDGNQVDPPSLALHVTPGGGTATCAAGAVACDQVVTKGGSSFLGDLGYYVYLLGLRGDSSPIKRIECGITYGGGAPLGQVDQTGIDVPTWQSCADIQSPANGWPAPGGSNTLEWTNPACDLFAPVVAGYFYVVSLSADTLRVMPRPNTTGAILIRCTNYVETVGPRRLGRAVFGPDDAPGCNPCLAECMETTPVEETTWSGIKSLFTR